MTRSILHTAVVLSLTTSAWAQAPAPAVPTNTATPAIAGVVAAGTTVEFLKSGFTGTEGPLGLPDGSLIFTETQANRITRIDKDTNATSVFLENTNGSNALGFDAKGRLISVQTTPGQTRIGVIYPKGAETTITGDFEGKPYGRPNDLVVAKNGGVYFTEPGPNATPGQPPPVPALSPAVYYVSPAGKVTTTPAGAVSSGADGLAIDAQGRLYCADAAGVEVFSPKGELLGVIPVSLPPQNIAFAGADKQTLYIVGRGSAFKVRLLARGYAGRAK